MEDHNRSTRRVTGLAGLGVAVLFGVGNALWALDQPAAGAPARVVVAFYTHTSVRIIAGASLSLLAAALFVLFASGVRAILREHEGDDVLATTAFGGAVLLVAAGLGAETINMVGALRAHDGQLTPGLARALFEISYVLGYNGAGVGIGILVLAIAAVALRARALLPRARPTRRRGRVHDAAVSIPGRAFDSAAGRGVGTAPQIVGAGRGKPHGLNDAALCTTSHRTAMDFKYFSF